MSSTKIIWISILAIYAAFFSWYTSLGGPLTNEEIEHYMSLIESSNPPPAPERLAQMRKFMEEDTGDDFVMVNVIHIYDEPLQIEGVEPGESSADVLDKYMEYMWPALLKRACHPVIFGTAASPAMDLMNAEGMAVWTTGAGMRYRSRRDILEISMNPAFAGSHEFKIAAMQKTIAFPIDPWMQAGDPRLLLALILGLIGGLISWWLAARE
jgi:hypothetical protein|tara:strand:- start:450 stop:1082 length:633 start_codon:yes stop_codon:yes gene_type:complete